MRKPQTLKRAVMIGATALLGVSAAIGTAHADGANTSDATKPAATKPAATAKFTDRTASFSTKVTGKHKSGKGAKFCAEPVDVPAGATFVSDSADKPGLKVSTKMIGKYKNGKGAKFCAEPVEPAKPALKK
ncbi:hypothetical protein CG747_42835 [Streptomyces sp. CB02959]|uniref:hypothetical protein n=1 Tax=Streptomyces sp. CB02959 TaxID=2020330 RepID=UPI000C27E70E|nr:hypothetical protein [Streptomyces sp. CB02959]PJN32420.1 hypothetical protein CG747_42835 [Streptomyces sp. CB02959]